MLHEEGVIEGEIVVEGFSDGAVVGSLHLLEGIDIVSDDGLGFGIEADVVIVGDCQFGKRDVLLHGRSDIIGVEHQRVYLVCDGARNVVLVGHSEVELRIVGLQKALNVLPPSRTLHPVENGKSEALADVVLGKARNIEDQSIRGTVSQPFPCIVNWIYQAADRFSEIAAAAGNHGNLCDCEEI